MRRLLFVSFSDYYHAHTKDYYEERKPIHDFGKGFFQEWNEQEWNLFYNFMLQCLHFYLSHPNKEFHAPDDNITINNLRSSIGDSFMEWAEAYFSDENLNTMISRQMMMFHYKDFVGNKSAKSPKSFKKALQNYCDLKGYILNPKELQRADGRIKKNDYNNYGQFTTVECFYVKSQ